MIIVYPLKELAKFLCIIGTLLAHSSFVCDKTWYVIIRSHTVIFHIERVSSHNALSPHLIQGTRPRIPILHRHQYYYPCQWRDGNKLCNYIIQADPRQLSSHLKEHHGVQGGPSEIHRCLSAECSMHLRRNSFTRHITSSHLGVKFRCLNCLTEFTRRYYARAHQEMGRACSEAGFQVIPGPSVRTVIWSDSQLLTHLLSYVARNLGLVAVFPHHSIHRHFCIHLYLIAY